MGIHVRYFCKKAGIIKHFISSDKEKLHNYFRMTTQMHGWLGGTGCVCVGGGGGGGGGGGAWGMGGGDPI